MIKGPGRRKPGHPHVSCYCGHEVDHYWICSHSPHRGNPHHPCVIDRQAEVWGGQDGLTFLRSHSEAWE